MKRLFCFIFSFFLLTSSLLLADEALNFRGGFLQALEKGLQTRAVQIPEETRQSFMLIQSFDQNASEINYHPENDHVVRVKYRLSSQRGVGADELLQTTYDYILSKAQELGNSVGSPVLAEGQVIELSELIRVVTFPYQIEGRHIRDAFLEVSYTKVGEGQYVKRELRNQTFAYLSYVQAPSRSDAQVLKDVTGMETFKVTKQEHEWAISSNGNRLVPATRFVFVDAHNNGYQVVIDDETRQIIEAEKKEYNMIDFQKLKIAVWNRSYMDTAPTLAVLPFTPLIVNGQTYQTSGDGSLENLSEVGDVTVVLQNARTGIHNRNFNAAPYRFSVTPSAEGVELNADNRRATNAYVAINAINLFARSYILPHETTFLDRRTSVRINFNEDTCNAYYNGQITLYAAGGGCANMAEVNDVIYHEWGHGLDDYTGRRRGIQDGAFSEGIGDILAAYYTNSSNMGAGFFTNRQTGIRQLDNNLRYPNDRGEIHSEGRIIGGAFWHMREALMARYGATKGHHLAAKYFFRHLLVTDYYTESYENVLTLDDDDGDATTRSPNFCLITEAFARHGLAKNPAGCVDDFEKEEAVLEDIRFALLPSEDEDGKVHIVVSYPEPLNMAICMKDTSCGVEALELTLDGRKEDRYVYRSETPLSLANHSVVRVETSDKSGLIGKRSFKIVHR